MKKPWLLVSTVLVVSAIVGSPLYQRLSARAENERETEYLNIAKSYSDTFKRGMARSEVEACIRSGNQAFKRTGSGNTSSDLIKVGDGISPELKWPCDGVDVYVVFEFEPIDPSPAIRTLDADKLITVKLSKQPKPCL